MVLTPARTCYIHIGTHKTGTTSIQAFLALNRERLSAKGVVLPTAGSDGDPGVATHHKLARELNATASPTVRTELDAVGNELRQSSATVACLSSEDFTFLWDKPAALERLRNVILQANFTPRIVVYLRPQVPYLIAIFAENVRHGYRKAFHEYLDDVLTRGHYVWGDGAGPPFDYDRLLDAFAAVFGRDALIVRRYRAAAPSRSLLISFARAILPTHTDFSSYVIPPTRYNGSLDFGSVLTLLDVQHTMEERMRFSPLGVAQTLRIWRRFRVSNANVAARYGVGVPAFEPLDLALAPPIRRTYARTRALIAARRLLTRQDSHLPDIGDRE